MKKSHLVRRSTGATFALSLAFASALALVLGACSPEVGSKDWCEVMKKKPKGEWSTNEATQFAKSCVL